MSLIININCAKDTFNMAVNCEIPHHGISGIYGPSGIGKTTLLRCLAGLENPSSGEIIWNNEPWFNSKVNQATSQRRVGFVFQDSRLFPHLTVRKNLSLAQQTLKQHRFDLEQLAATYNISDLLSKQANALSVGQQQRVAIVRSLLAQPQLLLLDEPLAALDSHNKQHIISQLKQHSQNHDLPMLYISHSSEEISQLCDNLLILDHQKTYWGPGKAIINQT